MNGKIARKINNLMNNDYIENVEVVHVDAILKDLFISDEIKEELLEEGFLAHYESGDYEIIVVTYDYNKTLVALNNFPSDPAEYLFHCTDGTVWVSSMLPAMEYEEGGWYAGDEIIQVDQTEPYENKDSWCYRSLHKVNAYKSLGVSVETMRKIVEGL